MRQHRLPATIGPDKVVPGVGDFKVEDGFVGESVFGGDDAEGGVVEAAERGAGFELADGDEAAFLEDEEGVGGSSGEGAGLAGGGVLDGEVDEVVGVVAEGADHAVDGLAVEGEGELVVGASFGVEDAAGEGDAFAVVDVAEASVAMGVADDHDDVVGGRGEPFAAGFPGLARSLEGLLGDVGESKGGFVVVVDKEPLAVEVFVTGLKLGAGSFGPVPMVEVEDVVGAELRGGLCGRVGSLAGCGEELRAAGDEE